MAVMFESLIGKVLTRAEKISDSEIIFETDSGEQFVLRHEQDCCESVYVEDICGDLEDLLGSPLLVAEESVNPPYEGPVPRAKDSYYTWTFYKLATIRGSVTIRFFGTSNGYYSERVDLVQIK